MLVLLLLLLVLVLLVLVVTVLLVLVLLVVVLVVLVVVLVIGCTGSGIPYSHPFRAKHPKTHLDVEWKDVLICDAR